MRHKLSDRSPSSHALAVIGWSLVTALVATAFFLLLNAWAISLDPEPLRLRLRASFESPTRTIGKSKERFTDCLIPVMTLLDDGSVLQRSISAQRVYRQRRGGPCKALRQLVYDGAIDPDAYSTIDYHQYWVGQRVVMKTLVPLVGVGGLRALFRWSTYIVLIGGVLLCLRWALGADRPFEPVALGLLLLSFLLFHDLGARAESFASGVTNLLIFSGLVATARLPLERWLERRTTLSLAAFGAVVAYFDLMLGAVLIGLVCLIAAISLAPRTATADTAAGLADPRPRALVLCCLAYVTGFSATMLLHVIAAEIVFDQQVLVFFWDQLSYRLWGGSRSTLPAEINPMFNSNPSLSRLLTRYSERLGIIGFGSLVAGRALLLSTVLAHGAAIVTLVRKWSDLVERYRYLGLLLSSLAIPIWYLVFLEHSQTHASLMIRLLSWNIGCAAVFVAAAAGWGRGRESSSPARRRLG